MHTIITQAEPSSLMGMSWLLPWAIALCAGILIILGKRFPQGKYVATAMAGIAAIYVSGMFYVQSLGGAPAYRVTSWTWLTVGSLDVSWDLHLDPLSLIMLVLVTWVGFLVHVYSLGYMHGDEHITRFFGYLNLFIASMMLLLVGANYLTLFVGWELVGLCSYLLVGFWFTNKEYAKAAKKAFIVNRIGDVGFLLAMFAMYKMYHTLDIVEVNKAASATGFDHTANMLIVLFMFVAATAKSAQIPLYIWLPDAMAGPTPVSALIHAATMVTAGIYLFARSTLLVGTVLPTVGPLIFWVGVLTATIAALTACFVYDYKKILAWSTISQLGYMFVAIGVGANTAAIFHLLTHGFFKALLFLSAGSVMHALANDTDIRHAGGLFKKMPITATSALIGVAAIAGIPGLSGFFSKEEILAAAAGRAGAEAVWVVGILVAGMTAFYMSRWFILIFMGKPRWEQGVHPHESPLTMTVPLIILAVLSALGGLINTPSNKFLGEWFTNIFTEPEATSHLIPHAMLMATAVGVAILGIVIAYLKFKSPDVHRMAHGGGVFGEMARNNFYWDNVYEGFNSKVAPKIARGLAIGDVKGIDGLVTLVQEMALTIAYGIRLITTGTLRYYMVGITFGILIMFGVTILASFGGI